MFQVFVLIVKKSAKNICFVGNFKIFDIVCDRPAE